MDYVEVFQNLRTNNKYGRKSPHKAVLMLTLIELYEQNVLSENEILYDDTLKTTFLKVWNRVLPDEPLFHSEAYLPFWYLQSDSFWHIVPNRGKEDILSLMRDNNIKPSEAKLYDCVKYAELDEDLYFLMTLPSGRSSLKRVLLESYTNLADKQIERLSESTDNAIDYSVAALSEYEKIFSKENTESDNISVETDSELMHQFQMLNEDIQIVLNLQYYSFLKSHRSEREMFKEICPTIYNLFDKIIHPIHQGDITPSFAFTYDNFLSDLKIALMSEEGSMELIDKIGLAIDLLRGNIRNVGSTEPIVETDDVETSVSDIEETSFNDEEDTSSQEYIIENKRDRCYIINNQGERVFSSDGQLIRLNDFFYRLIYSDSLVSMYNIKEDSNGLFILGRRILSAHSRSPLYASLDKHYYLTQFKAVKYDSNCDEYYIQVDNRWYGSSGFYADLHEVENNETTNLENEDSSADMVESSSDAIEVEHVFLDPCGNILDTRTSSSYDIPKTELEKEDRRGRPWTENEEELITLYFRQGKDPSKIAEIVGRTELAIKSRLGLLGLIDYTYGKDSELSEKEVTLKQETVDENNYSILNVSSRCMILDKQGEPVFSADGILKYINDRLYWFNLKEESFTVKNMEYNSQIWMKGNNKIVAYPESELYKIVNGLTDYSDDIEDIVDKQTFEQCKLRVAGVWYLYNGSSLSTTKNNTSVDASQFSVQVGTTLRLLPSQIIGDVIRLRIDAKGYRKLVINTETDHIVEVYDDKYLYEIINKNDKIKRTPRPRIKKSGVSSAPQKKTKAVIGNWIKWNPTGDVGKVVDFKSSRALKMIVIRRKDGTEMEVYDNPRAYDIIM